MRPLAILLLAFHLAPASSAALLVLKRRFAEVHKNRATLAATFTVDHVKKSVNSVKAKGEDGDLHIAGRAQKQVGLPMVVEIVNARDQKPAIDLFRAAEQSGQPVRAAGVWRIWFEHPGKEEHIQGNPVPKPTSTNPDHVFELHPVTAIAGLSLVSSFKMIPGYSAYPPSRSFAEYEKLTATIRATKTAISIDSRNAGFNYTEFDAEIPGEPKAFEDCVIALANILDDEDPEAKPASGMRRLVFLKDMAGLDKVRKGETIRVLAIPRLNLERLLDIVHGAEGQTLSNVPLPYEFIVVGITAPKSR
jgi:hypothetical protein